VTVPAGSTTATFRIETTTVGLSTDVQITARYQNVAINQIIRVTIPPPVPRFTVKGENRGEDKCTLTNNNGDNDCRLDASETSRGIRKRHGEDVWPPRRQPERPVDGDTW